MITEQIRVEVLRRIRSAPTETEIPDAIIRSLLAAKIDWRDVALDEMKTILVDAVRAWRRSHACSTRTWLCCA